MKSKITVLMSIAMILNFSSFDSNAQLSLPWGEKKTTTQETEAAKKAPPTSNDQLVNSFIAAQSKALEAQIFLANAFDLKDQATLLEVEKNAISSGALDTDGIKKSREVSNNAQAAISAKIAEDAVLSVEGKKLYTKAVPVYIDAVKLTIVLVNTAANYANSKGKGGMAGLTGMGQGLKSAAYVAKETPEFSKLLYDTSKKVVTYANKNKISVPKDSTAVLGNL